jgi:hypothetical protein
MPEFLKKFLKGLSDEEADKLWDWIDGTGDCDSQMIDTLLENHPDIVKAQGSILPSKLTK